MSKDCTRPETWEEWGEGDIDRLMQHCVSIGQTAARAWLRDTVGALLNRALKAEADRSGWTYAAARWREKYENTAEGAKKAAPREGWTAGDLAGDTAERVR